jgi:general secretion pathway protein E
MNNQSRNFFVQAGVISEQQYEEMVKELKENEKEYIPYIVTKGLSTYQKIAESMAHYFEIPLFLEITEQMADLDLLAKAPLPFLKTHTIIPVFIQGKQVILTAHPGLFQPVDELEILLGGGVSLGVSPYDVISNAINRYYPMRGAQEAIKEISEEKAEEVAFEELEEKDILTMASEAPIIKLVNNVLFQAVKQGASDIHIEPFEKEIRVRYRVDGVMHEIMSPPKRIQDSLVSRLKIMAHLNIAEKRIPQDGRIAIKVGDKAIDLRVSVLPTSFGERVVLRLLDKSRGFKKLDDMELNPRHLELLKTNIERPNGIIYITGPTGSGKTTTLYSLLIEVNKPDVNIITVEDPVEYQMKGIGQVQVREKVGLTFATALRSILRQDPDIVMIGETRDSETAQIAIQAALTGHLVLSTLHTNSAPAAITRLIDMGIEPFLIASSVELVVAQRLIRQLCQACKKKYKPEVELLKRIGLTDKQTSSITFYKALGCSECNNSGYRGRMPIFEIMPMSNEIAKLTMVRADTRKIAEQAKKEGMTYLVEDGIAKIKEGLTSIEEVLSVASAEQDEIVA